MFLEFNLKTTAMIIVSLVKDIPPVVLLKRFVSQIILLKATLVQTLMSAAENPTHVSTQVKTASTNRTVMLVRQ